jgi:hypothetical protein
MVTSRRSAIRATSLAEASLRISFSGGPNSSRGSLPALSVSSSRSDLLGPSRPLRRELQRSASKVLGRGHGRIWPSCDSPRGATSRLRAHRAFRTQQLFKCSFKAVVYIVVVKQDTFRHGILPMWERSRSPLSMVGRAAIQLNTMDAQRLRVVSMTLVSCINTSDLPAGWDCSEVEVSSAILKRRG